jgi:predicted S18 family serine protease
VGAIPEKIRAAAREGYRTILIPQGQLNGQFSDPGWNLTGLAMELGLTVKEVATMHEAYELMTGRRW